VYFGTTYPLPLVSANQTDVTYDPGTLDDNTSYSWQIIAWTDTLSTNGPVWTFTTEAISNNAPYTPADPSPIDGDTSISLDTELGWTGGDYDHEDTVTYTIYLGNTTPPPLYDTIGPYSAQETLLVYELSQLKYATKYYWRIEARDNHGKNTTGPIWEFTTQIYEVMCGDVTNNGVIDVGDVVYLINYLYRGGPEPQPLLCGGDCNHDDIVNVGDVVYLINYLFRGGPIPSGCCP